MIQVSKDPNVAALRRVLSSRGSVGTSVDWSAIESSWGHRFPSDFVAFIEAYGEGAIEDHLGIHAPEPLGDPHPLNGMVAETLTARGTWEDRPPRDLAAAEGEPPLISWGTDASADLLCWLTVGPDPDKWPVVVWARGSVQWAVFDCGMVEFLLKVFRAELDENPMSDLALWGNASPVFINRADEERLWASGIDPWTGEPDPYAGMFGD